MRRIVIIAMGTLVSFAVACSDSDVGTPCPELLGGTDPLGGDGGFTNTTEVEEVIEQNVSFPCASLVCVATAGDSGYCSKRCRNDAGCPPGFTCRPIQTIGPFADKQYCAFNTCEEPADCDDVEKFTCEVVPGVHPTEEVKLCRFKD